MKHEPQTIPGASPLQSGGKCCNPGWIEFRQGDVALDCHVELNIKSRGGCHIQRWCFMLAIKLAFQAGKTKKCSSGIEVVNLVAHLSQ